VDKHQKVKGEAKPKKRKSLDSQSIYKILGLQYMKNYHLLKTY